MTREKISLNIKINDPVFPDDFHGNIKSTISQKSHRLSNYLFQYPPTCLRKYKINYVKHDTNHYNMPRSPRNRQAAAREAGSAEALTTHERRKIMKAALEFERLAERALIDAGLLAYKRRW